MTETRRFTAKERDAETGLDFFQARYFSSAQGRFTSPDEFKGGAVDPFTGQQVSQPGPLPYADIRNPQSLNKYAYVLNNPLRYIDPDGHAEVPSEADVIKELNRLADSYNVPDSVVRAVARTESNFNVNAVGLNRDETGEVTSTDYGLIQVNSKNIGGSVTGTDGKPIKVTEDIKTDWKTNAKVGTAMVAQEYKAATKSQPTGTGQTRAQQAYSGYNAGPKGRTRYKQKTETGEYVDRRDKKFLENYRREKERKEE